MQNQRIITKAIFDSLFREFYQDLCRFAYKYLQEEELSDDVVQEVFINLWEKRKNIPEIASFKSYLYKAVRNKCIDTIRKQLRNSTLLTTDDDFSEISYIDYSFENIEKEELKLKIEESISSLPINCRNVFTLSREAKLTYGEIAEELGISRKTVENQIGIAIKKIRKYLIDSKVITIILVYFFYR